ncbi:MAG: murein L,D-transpeptidase [Spirochaetota bacterium]|nr:murein L,D-transpeptidase [Spirochaetota bacterium]
MKKIHLIIISVIILIATVVIIKGLESRNRLIHWPATDDGSGIPSSGRFEEARNRVKPRLIKDLASKKLHFGSPIFIRIFKKEKVLELWIKQSQTYRLFRVYPICYYSGKLGPKYQEGDKQSPEGFYYVRGNRMNPWSRFHLSFNIGFPNTYDRAHGRTGSFIMVHGDCVSIGCYAMTDKKMEEIYILADAALRQGQSFFRVHIFPFRMSRANMDKYRDSINIAFWKNLREGYLHFEKKKVPPNVKVKNKRYIFTDSK